MSTENTAQPNQAAAPAATTETPAAAPAQTATPAAAPVEQAPKLAPGLFKQFSLGSTLVQGSQGNQMANVKASPMDYQKQLDGSTKNQKMSAEQLKELQNKK